MKAHRHPRGLSLAEVMVVAVILSGAAMAFIQGFSGIMKGSVATRAQSRAVIIAQSQIRDLKSRGYDSVLASTTTLAVPGVSGAWYDPSLFPPWTSTYGAITFTRYTVVERMLKSETDETLSVLPPGSPDSGFKRVTVTVAWTERGATRHVSQSHILQTVNRTQALYAVTGVVYSTGGATLDGATVRTTAQADWSFATDAVSNANGNFTLRLPPGTYQLVVDVGGYDTYISSSLTLTSANSPLSRNVTLQRSLVGSVTGAVWVSSFPVISQVVASTVSAGYSQEYVEVFNPTTWTWTVSGGLGLRYQGDPAVDVSADPISLTYNTASLAAGKFYLFANTSPVVVAGVSRAADAVWSTAGGNAVFPLFAVQNNIMAAAGEVGGGAGLIELYAVGGGATWDRVGWSGAASPAGSETSPVADPGGFLDGESYRRLSSTVGVSDVYGPAYDSGNNSVDFAQTTPVARNSAVAAQSNIAGVPAVGAWVFVTDSPSPTAAAALTGSPPYAAYTTPARIGGGYIYGLLGDRSNGYFASFAGQPLQVVTVSSTAPVTQTLFLTQQNTMSVYRGTVRNSLGTVLPDIPVGSFNTVTDASGNYTAPSRFIGGQCVWANKTGTLNNIYGNAYWTGAGCNTGYAVYTGVYTGATISLPAQARVWGYVARENVDSPYLGLVIQDSTYNYSGTSNALGLYVIPLSEGSYTFSPSLPTGRVSSPVSASVSINSNDAGREIFVSTFVVTQIPRGVRGIVVRDGALLSRGGLVVALDKSMYPTPLAAGATPPLFISGSTPVRPDGSYEMPLAYTAAGYNLYAYTVEVVSSTPTVFRADQYNVIVSSSAGWTAVDFTY